MQKAIDSQISLYLDLFPNKIADMETVASITLSLNYLIKEFIYVMDPSLNIEVGLISGEEGSLWLKGVIKAASKVKKKHPILSNILGAAIVLFLTAPFNHLTDEFWHKAFDVAGIKWDDGISPEDIKKISDAVSANMKNQTAVEYKSKIYDTLKKDNAIKGMGASNSNSKKPSFIIPKEEFHLRQSEYKEIEISRIRFVERDNYRVTLIRAVLVSKAASWRFQHGDISFNAKMDDQEFLKLMESGHTGIELGQGIEMTLKLKVQQEYKNSVWVDKVHTVMKVISIKSPMGEQLHLFNG